MSLSSESTISEKPSLTLDPQAQTQVIRLWASGLTFAVGPAVPLLAPSLWGGEPLHGRPKFSLSCAPRADGHRCWLNEKDVREQGHVSSGEAADVD